MSKAAAIVVLGPGGLATARRATAALPGSRLHGWSRRLPADAVDLVFEAVADHLRALFQDGVPIVAICASGIVIRALAPLLADKRVEPPVVAIAEDGSAIVPLLGGHRGANRLAGALAQALGGTAAITTASEVLAGFALDEPPPGWTLRNPDAGKGIMADLVAGRPVRLEDEDRMAGWLAADSFGAGGARAVVVTERDDAGDEQRLVLHPRRLALGVGCERGVESEELIALVEATLARHRLAAGALACVVSLDLKAAEPAVHALAARLGVPARFVPAAVLEAETPRLANPSDEVFRAVGCHGVAEAAALAAAGPDGELVVAKTRSQRCTCAIARAPSPIEPETAGRPQGELAIIGIGPGHAAWRTPEADRLLERCAHWVGYRGYLELLGSAPAAKRLHPFALGEEEARCRRALDLAAGGERVALVSSGDAGIYGMAALVVELLEQGTAPAWSRVALTVSPGVSALQAAAARAGAPLGHDFCAISLSDLMTPWPVIERRLLAAAEADFVTVLYNPASGRRRRGLARALEILATARPAATPVVLARNLGRAGETVDILPLAAVPQDAVDMLSLLIVGSNHTRALDRGHGRRLAYTPRGYLDARAEAP
jgi:cobalt-precorrin 5A hydrolase / precorrin-3B C17-methyltransferase